MSQFRGRPIPNIEVRYHYYPGWSWNEQEGKPAYDHFHQKSHIWHHKAVIINGNILVTGSYNWSSSAEIKNLENIMIFSGPEEQHLVDGFMAEFDAMWKDPELAGGGDECRRRRDKRYQEILKERETASPGSWISPSLFLRNRLIEHFDDGEEVGTILAAVLQSIGELFHQIDTQAADRTPVDIEIEVRGADFQGIEGDPPVPDSSDKWPLREGAGELDIPRRTGGVGITDAVGTGLIDRQVDIGGRLPLDSGGPQAGESKVDQLLQVLQPGRHPYFFLFSRLHPQIPVS